MRATVVVESQEEFDQWLDEQAASAGASGGAASVRERRDIGLAR